MKFAMLSLALIFAGLNAGATSLMYDTQSAPLTQFQFDSESPLSHREILNGNIQINHTTREVTLTLQPAWHCPPGAACALVMPQPIEVTLPLVRVMNDRCGTSVWTAEVNHLPVDGNLQRLTVIDNSNNRCPHLVALNPTEVVYEEAGGGRGNYFSFRHKLISNVSLK